MLEAFLEGNWGAVAEAFGAIEPFLERLPKAQRFGLDEFLLASSLLQSRTFGDSDNEEQDGEATGRTQRVCASDSSVHVKTNLELFPLLDLLNHDARPALWTSTVNGSLVMHAQRDLPVPSHEGD